MLVLSCTSREPPSPSIVERARVAMGSELRLTAWTADERTALAAFDAVFAEFERLDSLLSVWREGSDVNRLNAAAGITPVPVAQETLEVLTLSHQMADLTDGKFDITFAALSDLWKFDHDQNNVVPAPERIQERLPLIDFRAVSVDVPARTAYIAGRGMRAHLGGIGKGYAVDRSVSVLFRHGVRDFMIQAGGDMYVSGKRGDRPWRLGIQDPRGSADQVFAALELADASMSTSGDYERFFIKGGRRFHHILDPDRGEPADLCRSVTVVADRAAIADGLSTGVFVMGPEAGMALVERLPQVEAVIVTADNRLLVSSGLTERLDVLARPSP
jgi:thiamine biosynthesis lipoprotein